MAKSLCRTVRTVRTMVKYLTHHNRRWLTALDVKPEYRDHLPGKLKGRSKLRRFLNLPYGDGTVTAPVLAAHREAEADLKAILDEAARKAGLTKPHVVSQIEKALALGHLMRGAIEAHAIAEPSGLNVLYDHADQTADELRAGITNGTSWLAATAVKPNPAAADAYFNTAHGITPAEAPAIHTFRQTADLWLDAKCAPLRRAKEEHDRIDSLFTRYASNLLNKDVAAITADHVLDACEPVWNKAPTAARKLRQSIADALDYAASRGWRDPVNPARWRGHMSHLLGKQAHKTTHHPAPKAEDIPDLFKSLTASTDTGAAPLMFAILTGARSIEARSAVWSEIDLKAAVWTIPGDKMKKGKELRVALAPAAIDLLRRQAEQHPHDPTDYVFPGQGKSGIVSDGSLSKLMTGYLDKDGRQAVVHGCRSTMQDWLEDVGGFEPALVEAALSHVAGDATRQSYRRGDGLERRREMMAAWADHVIGGTGTAEEQEPAPAKPTPAITTHRRAMELA